MAILVLTRTLIPLSLESNMNRTLLKQKFVIFLLFTITILNLGLLVQPQPVLAYENNCPLGIRISANRSSINQLSDPIVFTITAMRDYPLGDYCNSTDQITAYIRLTSNNADIGPVSMQINPDPANSGRTQTATGTFTTKIEGLGANATAAKFDFTARATVQRSAANFSSTLNIQSQNIVSIQNLTSSNPSAYNCKRWLFITDSQGKEWGNGTTVKLNATGYTVKAKIEKCDSGYSYQVRVFQIIDDDSAGAKQVITPKSGNSSAAKEFISGGLVFDKLGSYSYYLDYKDQASGNFTNINKITVTVSEQAGATPTNTNSNTGIGSNANVPAVAAPKLVDIAKINNPFGSVSTFPGLVARGIDILLALIVIAAVVVIVVAGFRMVVGGSSPEQLKKAKSTIVWAILGLLVAFVSFAIVQIIQGLL